MPPAFQLSFSFFELSLILISFDYIAFFFRGFYNVPQQVIIQNAPDNAQESELSETIRLLRDRLDEPFLTVNSVTGETGMKQAQDEYDKLIRNKTPKSRR